MACYRHGGELFVGDLDSGRVVPLVELGVDFEALSRCRVRDELDEDPVGGERATAPVHRDEAEQPVLDVPLRGAGWVVTDRDLEAGRSGELGELDLPCPDPVAVGPAGISTHEQARRIWVSEASHLGPPTRDGGDGKAGGVGIVAYRNPPLVGTEVVDTVGDRLSHLGVDEVVDLGPRRGSLRLELPAGIGVLADELLLLRVHADHGLAVFHESHGRVVDVVELGVTVHVLGALFLFRGPLEAIAHLSEQGSDRPRADRKAFGLQCPGDVVGRLGRPTKR